MIGNGDGSLTGSSSGNDNSSEKEMEAEIEALIGAIAKAFGISEAEAIKAAEGGAITMEFGTDNAGNRFVAASYGEQNARIYQGAIKYTGSSERSGA